MKLAEGRRMRFGRLPRDENISSRQLQIENKVLEEKLSTIKKFCEEERKKTESKQPSTNSSKGFAIRDLKRINIRPSERELAQQAKESQQQKQMFAKKGIRAYEEVVKSRKNKLDQPKEELEQGLLTLLESLNMAKFVNEFKKAGIYTLETLKDHDIPKLGLLPGYEIKLNKKITELKSKQADPKPKSQAYSYQSNPNDYSDEDADFLTKKSVPTERPRRYKQLLGKQKSIHEDSTMCDLKHKQSQSILPSITQDDFSCGPDDSHSKKPHISCWYCLTLIAGESTTQSHPILVDKVAIRMNLDILQYRMLKV